MNKSNFKGHVIISLVLLSLIPLQKGFSYFIYPFQIEEIRPVVSFVQNNQEKDDQVYIHEDAIPAVQFYQNLHDNKQQYQLNNLVYAPAYQKVDELILDRNGKRVWLVFSHLLSDFSQEEVNANKGIMEETHSLEKTLEVKGAAAYLYVPK